MGDVLVGRCRHRIVGIYLFAIRVLVPSVEPELSAMIDRRLYLFQSDTSDSMVYILVIRPKVKALDDGASKVAGAFRRADFALAPSFKEVIGLKRGRCYRRGAWWSAHLCGSNVPLRVELQGGDDPNTKILGTSG